MNFTRAAENLYVALLFQVDSAAGDRDRCEADEPQ